MRHLMRAEHEDAESADPGAVKTWHMVRGEESVAMCGRELRPDARTLPEAEWFAAAEPACHTCGALYLREVP
ncbi:hypothetical protein [Streptomyces sp. URMC 129]|uniref:hypothetical protein n=1 Tax=Streptomyces sp. URMC 129 TaxID=3423407 RepID=UPI003F192DF9